MAYDEEFAQRIREVLVAEDGIREKAMFGGLAFLLNGNMAVGVSSGGELMVRIAPEDTDDVLAKPHARLFEMGGRSMSGWILVAREGVKTKSQLTPWVRRGLDYAATLPPKG
jgi:TfoX/Sxy family transcriptional regulator of competence genes